MRFYFCMFTFLKPGLGLLRCYLQGPTCEISPLFPSQEKTKWLLLILNFQIVQILLLIVRITLPEMRNFKNVLYSTVRMLQPFNVPWVKCTPKMKYMEIIPVLKKNNQNNLKSRQSRLLSANAIKKSMDINIWKTGVFQGSQVMVLGGRIQIKSEGPVIFK